MGKKLTVFMIDGTEFGPRTIEIGNWVGKGVYTTRASINKINNRPEFNNPGVYCLKSSPNEASYNERIYIGEAENIGSRLKQQLSDANRDFEELIFFVSKDELLTKTQIKYLESRLINMSHEAKSAEIENISKPALPLLHEADISDMEYFLDQIKLILPLMGFKFLIPLAVKISTATILEEPTSLSIFRIKSEDIDAKMYTSEQGFIVIKGSFAKKSISNSMTKTYVNLRNKLIDTGILVENGKFLEFIEDTVFSSPSAASNIVLGRQSAGPIYWIDQDGKTYKQVAEDEDLSMS